MTTTKRIPTPEEGNPHYPLPPDYFNESMTEDGRRQARVNACRQWTLWRDGSHMEGYSFVMCRRLFDAYYLSPELDEDGQVVFDPMFYRTKLPTPAFHELAAYTMATQRMSALVAPRGAGKSASIQVPLLMGMVTQHKYTVTYCTSTNELAEEVGDNMKYQCYHNSRLSDDFSPEYGGRLKPSKSEGKMGMSNFKLSNRSGLFTTSAESRQRGMRPVIYVLDDPEHDPRASTQTDVLREGLDFLIKRVALPMVQAPDTSLFWQGTYVSPAHLLWHATQTDEVKQPDGTIRHVARDPSFGRWFRIVIPAIYEEEGKLKSCWPYLWPIDEAEKKSLNLRPNTQTMEQVRADVTEQPFQAEYMANPLGAAEGYFDFKLNERRHGWWFEFPDEHVDTAPYRSSTFLCWYDGGELKRQRLSEFCGLFRRAITADTSYTANSSSDFKAAMCMALNDQNVLFVFDAWAQQIGQDVLVREGFRMADRWRAASIHPEKIKEGIGLAADMLAISRTRAADAVGVEHLAQVVPFVPGMAKKEDRIAGALHWRFTHDKIKVPIRWADRWPWREFFLQIRCFNPNMRDGGLQKDDLLDVCQMGQNVFKGRPINEPPQRPVADDGDVDARAKRFMDGDRTDQSTGLPLAYSVLHTLSRDDILKAMAHGVESGVPRGGAV